MRQPHRRWNHNIHYYPRVLEAVPPGCERALDVGCGEGMLARQLTGLVEQVTGIDEHEPSIELAREQSSEGRSQFIVGDFLAHPFPAESFGLISSVAALHHMDASAALARMKQLLAPGGRLVVIGLARSELPDLPRDAAATLVNLGYRVVRGHWDHPSPIVWPPPHTYRQIAAVAEATLPGVTCRRLLMWRYLLTWAKPPQPT